MMPCFLCVQLKTTQHLASDFLEWMGGSVGCFCTLPHRKDDEDEEEKEEEEITHTKAFEEIVLDVLHLIDHELKSNVKGWKI